MRVLACLSSRFVYGETISEEKLHMVDEAEQLFLDMGFHQVRVRIHGQGNAALARSEIMPEEFTALLKTEDLGFAYIALDLRGYRTGIMN